MTGSSVLAVADDASARSALPADAGVSAASARASKAAKTRWAKAKAAAAAAKAADPQPRPVCIDTSLANRARLRELFLHGKEFFETELAVWHRLAEFLPQFPLAYLDERNWRGRVAAYLVQTAGVRQFVVCQPGFPEHLEGHEVHEIVQALDSEASVLYVEEDQVAAAYGRAFREINDRIKVVNGQLDAPQRVFASRAAQSIIDLDEPVALLQVGSLQHIPNTKAAQRAMAAWVDPLAAGSYVAVSHLYMPGHDSEASAADRELAAIADRVRTVFNSHGVPTAFRTAEQISAFFAGLELIEPAVVAAGDWWPVGPPINDVSDAQRLVRAGVAIKPATPRAQS